MLRTNPLLVGRENPEHRQRVVLLRMKDIADYAGM